jgi:hypothetical protein
MRRTLKPGNSGECKRYVDFASLRQRVVEHLPKADAESRLRAVKCIYRRRLAFEALRGLVEPIGLSRLRSDT